MTVRNLIIQLLQYPLDAPVYMAANKGYFNEPLHNITNCYCREDGQYPELNIDEF